MCIEYPSTHWLQLERVFIYHQAVILNSAYCSLGSENAQVPPWLYIYYTYSKTTWVSKANLQMYGKKYKTCQIQDQFILFFPIVAVAQNTSPLSFYLVI